MSFILVGTTAAATAASVFSSVKAGKANKANQALVDKQSAEDKAEKDMSANRSYLDTNEGKDAVKVAKEESQDSRKNIEGNAVITGASDEAKLAANSSSQKNFNNSVSHLAAAGTGYAERAKSRYQASKMALLGQQQAINNQKAENAGNIAKNAASLASAGAGVAGMAKSPTATPTASLDQNAATSSILSNSNVLDTSGMRTKLNSFN